MTTEKWSIRQSAGQRHPAGGFVAGPNRWILWVGDRPATDQDEPTAELLDIFKKLPAPDGTFDLGIAVAESGVANDRILRLKDAWHDPDVRGRWKVLTGVRDGSIPKELAVEVGREWAAPVAKVVDHFFGTLPPKPKPVVHPKPKPETKADKRTKARAHLAWSLAEAFGVALPLGSPGGQFMAERAVKALDAYLDLRVM